MRQGRPRRCSGDIPVRSAGPGRRTSDVRRQVSWLTGRCVSAAFPIRLDSGVGGALAAYSCGHSRGLEAEPRTAFPFHVLADEPSQGDV